MRHRKWILGLALALAVAACGADDVEPGGEAPEETEVTPEAPDDGDDDAGDEADAGDDADEGEMAATTIEVADSELGSIVVDQEGLTLYMFDPDEGGESTCYDDCAATWPPLEGPAEAGDGVDESALGTTERDDGTTQVTLGGWPLYYFAGDEAPGDVNGQGVNDVWWVIDGSGNPVQDGEAAGDMGSRDGY